MSYLPHNFDFQKETKVFFEFQLDIINGTSFQEAVESVVIERSGKAWNGKFEKVSSQMGRIKMFFLILCLAGGVVTTLWLLGTFTNVLKFRNIIREIRKIKNILKITTTRVSNRWGMKARNIRKRLGAKAKIEEEMV